MSTSSNTYYPILIHALKKEDRPIDPEIEEYKKCLIENSETNYQAVSSKRSFPYCLCSLSHLQVERAVEIEYVTVTPRSMRIGLVTFSKSILKRKNNQNFNENKISNSKKYLLNREVLILRCRCMPYRPVDWRQPANIKLIGLLSDYRYKIEGSLIVLNSIFEKDGQIEKEKETDLEDADAIQHIESALKNEKIKDLLSTPQITKENNDLIWKIIKNTRTEKEGFVRSEDHGY